MSPQLTIPLMILAAYLFGSAPYGVLVGAAHGVDVTAAGSRNIGATNVGRLVGRKWGILVFLLDVMKGLVPTLLASFIVDGYRVAGVLSPASAQLACLATGLSAIFGHNYSFLLRFKGGRGVATSLGVCLGFYPELTVPALAAFGLWGVVLAIARYVSLASISAAIAFPLLAVVWLSGGVRVSAGESWPAILFAVVVAGLGVYRHRANIRRLRAGTEPKIGQKSTDPPRPRAAPEH